MVDQYLPSTLVTDAVATPYPAIIDVSFTTGTTATLCDPRLHRGAAGLHQHRDHARRRREQERADGRRRARGLLRHRRPISPQTLQLGIVNRVVQKTFKVVSSTTTGSPRVVSTAVVQINDYGEYVVNSWEISVA